MITPHEYQEDLVCRVRSKVAAGCRRVLAQAAVGAGKTVIAGRLCELAVAKGKRVLFLVHRRRLNSQMSRTLDDFGIPHGILMRGHDRRSLCPVQVASRDTLLSRAVRNEFFDLPPADLVITDEAHRAESAEYRRLLETYPDAVHVGLTATPAFADGKGMGCFYQAIECCVPIPKLIELGRIVPVRCYAPQNRTAARRKLAGDPVSEWKARAEGRPTVLFAGAVKPSEAARDAFLEAGIPAAHVDAHTPDEERERVIADLEAGRIMVLCNCSILTEGVDIPAVSCIQLLRLASSYILFIQAIGRGMRAHPGKRDCLLIDHADAVLEHGFPDEDVRWDLDETNGTVEQRNREDRKEGKRSTPVTCPACGLQYKAAVVCPECGHRLPRRLQPAVLKNQILTEVEKALTPEEKAERRVRYWHECLRIMAHKGMTCGAAAGMFRGRYREGPDASLPNYPCGAQWKMRAGDAFPQYLKGRDE